MARQRAQQIEGSGRERDGRAIAQQARVCFVEIELLEADPSGIRV
ncbi:hypothetical protein ACSFBL_22850 [Variovorax sp. GT1P44]